MKPIIATVCLYVVLVAAVPCSATERLWCGEHGADWYNAANWAPPGAPQPGDTLTITGSHCDPQVIHWWYPHIDPPFVSSGQIYMEGGILSGSLTCGGEFHWTGGSLGEQSRSTIILNIAPTGSFFINANGLVCGTVINQGRMVWGDAPDTVVVRGEGVKSSLVNYGEWIIGGVKGKTWTRALESDFRIENHGIVRVQVDSATALNVPFLQQTADAELVVEAGAVRLYSGGTVAGRFTAAEGTGVDLGAGAFLVTSDFRSSGLGFIGAGMSATASLQGELSTSLACYSAEVYFDDFAIKPTGVLSFYGDCVFKGTLNNRGQFVSGEGRYRGEGVGCKLLNHGEWLMAGPGAQSWTRGSESDFRIINQGVLRNGFDPMHPSNTESTLSVTVENGGTIQAQTGAIHFGPDCLVRSGGKLAVQLNSLTDFGRLHFQGSLALGDGFGVTLVSGFTPPVGSGFTVLTADSISGAFLGYSGLGIKEDVKFTPVLGPAAFALLVESMPAASEPALSIVPTGDLLLVWWPEWFPGYELLSCTNLATPTWEPYVLTGTNQSVMSARAAERYFKTGAQH